MTKYKVELRLVKTGTVCIQASSRNEALDTAQIIFDNSIEGITWEETYPNFEVLYEIYKCDKEHKE